MSAKRAQNGDYSCIQVEQGQKVLTKSLKNLKLLPTLDFYHLKCTALIAETSTCR